MGDIEHILSEEAYSKLEKDIKSAQDALRKKNPFHPLLNLVRFNELGMLYDFSGDVGEKYLGMEADEGFAQYVADLKSAARNTAAKVFKATIYTSKTVSKKELKSIEGVLNDCNIDYDVVKYKGLINPAVTIENHRYESLREFYMEFMGRVGDAE